MFLKFIYHPPCKGKLLIIKGKIWTENKLYYDNERINIPKGKCAKQVGVYNYKTKSGDYKTVPVVIIK